jgi:hypothetical protein
MDAGGLVARFDQATIESFVRDLLADGALPGR